MRDVSLQSATSDPKDSSRVAWIDISKGLGIFLVIFGHTVPGAVTRFIYVFHMPFFFFISGHLHKPHTDFGLFFRKRSINLFLPYVCFLAVIACLILGHELQHGIYPLSPEVANIVWGGEQLRDSLGIAWFITCLFLTQQIANLFIVFTSRIALCLALTIGLLLAYVNQVWFPSFTLPWDANVIAASLPFFLFGYLTQKRRLNRTVLNVFAGSSAIIAAVAISKGMPISMDMRDARYGVPLLTIALAPGLIAGIVLISEALGRAGSLGRFFASAGALSMVIMFVHKALTVFPVVQRVGYLPSVVQFLFYSAVSYVIARVVSRNRWSRIFLMGSTKDLKVPQKAQYLESTFSRNKEEMTDAIPIRIDFE